MKLTNQHRALLITFLITGTLLLFVFNLSLIKKNEVIAESYYELEPEKELTEEDVQALETLEKINAAKAETNDAFNETQKSKRFAGAFTPIEEPEDYVPKSTEGNAEGYQSIDSLFKRKPANHSIKKEDLSSFNKVKDLLDKQKEEGSNSKSSISFSLVDRKKIHIPIPVYLCETNGRVIINITVNSSGDVIDAYVNNASSSTNQCLVEHALQYAKDSQFSANLSKKTQLGTITFNFIGKH